MVETLVLAGIIAAVIVWWRISHRRPHSSRPAPLAYTRPPSLGSPGIPLDDQAGYPAGNAALAAKVRQQAFDTFDRFGPGGDPQILADAAEGFRRAADLSAAGDPRKARDLVHVSTVLQQFYDETTELWALNDAVAAARAALEAGPDEETRGNALLRLGICLHSKFGATKESGPLAESADVLRTAAAMATPARPLSMASFYHLAAALHSRYDATHDPSFLEEAVAAGRRAAQNADPLQVPAICQLVCHLRELSGVREDPAVAREAEAVARHGVRLTASAGPEEQSWCLFELARALENLGLRTGSVDYLREAVDTVDEAVRRTQDPIDRHLRGAVGTGMVAILRRQLQPASDPAGEPAEGPASAYDDRPPPPPPLDATG